MMDNVINIGIPSKGRLKKDVLKIFKKKKLNLISERGERDLIGSIKEQKKCQNFVFTCQRNHRKIRR
jgi:ATP phosphoribosyltransferase